MLYCPKSVTTAFCPVHDYDSLPYLRICTPRGMVPMFDYHYKDGVKVWPLDPVQCTSNQLFVSSLVLLNIFFLTKFVRTHEFVLL